MCMYIDTKFFGGVFVRVFLTTGFCMLRFWPIWKVYRQSKLEGVKRAKNWGSPSPILVVSLLCAVLIF